MQKNKCLVYLGLGSNAISAAAQVGFAKSLVKNHILQVVDFRNNEEVAFEDMDDVDTQFDAVGNNLLIKWEDDSKLLPIQSAMFHAGQDLWYFRPYTVTKYCHLDSSCRLMQMDIPTILRKHPHAANDALVLRWMVRPVTVGRDLADLKQQFLEQTMKGKKPGKITHEPYFYLNSLVHLSWEVRIVHLKNVIYKHEEKLDEDFPTRNFHDVDPIMPWVACSAILKDLPKKGTIEVRLIVRSQRVGEVTFDASALVSVEVKSTWGCMLENKEMYYAGGDGPSSEVDTDQLQYSLEKSYHAELGYPELKYHNILRGMVWNNGHCKRIKLRWRMKLYVVHEIQLGNEDDLHMYDEIGRSSASGNEDRPDQFNLIQYEWAVSVHPWFGSRRVVESQRCDGKVGTTKTICDPFRLIEYYESRTQEEKEMDLKEAKANEIKSSSVMVGDVDRSDNDDVDPLLAWTWQTFETEMDNVLAGDCVILTAKLVSPNPRAAAKLASNCRIKAEDFEVYQVVGDIHQFTNEQLQKIVPICFDPQAIFDSPVRSYNINEQLYPGEYAPDHIFNLSIMDYANQRD